VGEILRCFEAGWSGGSQRRRVVLKLSGRLFNDVEVVASYVELIRELSKVGWKIVVVAGGGGIAREYISMAERLGAPPTYLDMLGIEASRLNALLMISALNDIAYPSIPKSVEEVRVASVINDVVVLGGLQPGQSTATVAALVAEAVGSKLLVNCANVDGVYTSDPRRDPNARRLDRVKTVELRSLVESKPLPGYYELFDIWSLEILSRSGITMYVIDGRRVDLVRRALYEGVVEGTVVEP